MQIIEMSILSVERTVDFVSFHTDIKACRMSFSVHSYLILFYFLRSFSNYVLLSLFVPSMNVSKRRTEHQVGQYVVLSFHLRSYSLALRISGLKRVVQCCTMTIRCCSCADYLCFRYNCSISLLLKCSLRLVLARVVLV